MTAGRSHRSTLTDAAPGLALVAGSGARRIVAVGVSLGFNAAVVAALVTLLPVSRRSESEPVRLVFVDALPRAGRSAAPEPGRAAEEATGVVGPAGEAPGRGPSAAPAPRRRAPEPPAARPGPERPRASGPRPAPSPAVAAAAPGDAAAHAEGPGGDSGATDDRIHAAATIPVPPVLLRHEMPRYPPEARRREIEGVVLLEAVVDREGRIEPESIRVRESVALLDAAAIEAVRRWRFRPGRNGRGVAVRVILEIPIRFVLR
jgi:protein TonB